MNTLFGIKKQMIATYDTRGRRVGATVLEIGPNFVTQIKKKDGADAYTAVQLGFGTKKSVKKPQVGHAKKAGVEVTPRWLREVKADRINVDLGQQISVGDVFRTGDEVKVSGISKGRGFQGGVKRHGFAGGPKTHGQSDRHRAPGSIGQGTTPGRVYKGKKMAGHMGSEKVTVRGLEVVGVDKGNNWLMIKGGIPGAVGSPVIVEKMGRIKGYIAPPEEKEEEETEGEGVEKESVTEESKGEENV
ncbi:MAG: 50S ribosomal protein L3 [Armatimonadetes bacterium]|nr:MAG: 50S ribosomal protein L3 [Armatimonadota bacterium]